MPGDMAEARMTAVREWISQYTVNATPPGSDQYNHLWDITVDRSVQIDGQEWWAVRWSGRRLNRATGEWDLEPQPSSSRTEEWLLDHSYGNVDMALHEAHRAAPEVTVNGLKASDVTPRTTEGDPTK